MAVAVLVPLKAFAASKLRLATVLNDEERAALVRSMAERVLAAAAPLPVTVVCDDPAVARWAAERAASVLRVAARGLDRAAEEGVRTLADAGYDQVVVCHADLPFATDLSWVADFAGVSLVADRHGDGTNVACVPTSAGFRFSYGPGSCARHIAEAHRLGLPLRVLDDPMLGWDVDVPDDLAPAAHRHGALFPGELSGA